MGAKKNDYGMQANSKLTPEVVKKLEEAFAIDCSIPEACFYANISKQTYYNWIKMYPELKEKFDRLRNRPILLARQEVVKGLRDNPEFSLKYLERKRKQEFGLRQDVGIEGSLNIKIVNYEEVKNEEDEENEE